MTEVLAPANLSADSQSTETSARLWMALRLLGLVLLLIFGVWWIANFSAGYLISGSKAWFRRYKYLGVDFQYNYLASRYWLSGGDPYTQSFGDPLERKWVYAPLVLRLFAWTRAFGFQTALILWTLAQIFIIGLAAQGAARARRALQIRPLPYLLVLALTVWSTPVIFALERGNCDTLVLLALVVAVWALRGDTRWRDLVIACALAIAIWIKVYPALCVLGLIALGRKRAVWFTFGATAVVGLMDPSGTVEFFSSLPRLFAFSHAAISQHFDAAEHSLSSAWELWAGPTIFGWMSGPVFWVMVLLPAIRWVSLRVYQSPRRAELSYGYLLWLAAVATLMPRASNDYNLIFLPLAALCVWDERDSVAVQSLKVLFVVWWQPRAFSFDPALLLVCKLSGIVSVAVSLVCRADLARSAGVAVDLPPILSSQANRRAAFLALAVLLAIGVPIHLRTPLWLDATLYDLAARNVLAGGVHYRDIFDTNLPGMVWLHTGLRSLVGWSPEAMKAADLLVVAAIIALLVRHLRAWGVAPAFRVWTIVALFGCYFSLSEWNHVQRDIWMLLPALTAVALRGRQIQRLRDSPEANFSHAIWAALEGLTWGLAVWIKPFVAVPAAICWALALAELRRSRTRHHAPGTLTFDSTGLIAGIVLATAAGLLWLWRSNAWPYFWDTLLRWNPGYWAHFIVAGARATRLREWWNTTFPWSVLHLVALPVSVGIVLRGWRRTATPPPPMGFDARLFAGLYLGWVIQAALLQAPHDYVLAPTLLLAIVACVGLTSHRQWSSVGRVCLPAFVLVAVIQHPLGQIKRLRTWPATIYGPGTDTLRDRLTLEASGVNWNNLAAVTTYLLRQGVGNGDVLCVDDATHPLYLALDLKPSLRYVHFRTTFINFPTRDAQLWREVAASTPRFIVSDLLPDDPLLFAPSCLRHRYRGRLSLFPRAAEGESSILPQPFGRFFPWCYPVVFRAGRYAVHQVAPNTPVTLLVNPGSITSGERGRGL